jgi:UDP-glucuronate decarboxylase
VLRGNVVFFDYLRQFVVDIHVLRIFNTYGYRLHPRDGRVVSNFIVQALFNGPITHYEDGKKSRSFCYVDDLVDGLVKMMGKSTEIGPINMGNPVEFTKSELSDTDLRLTGAESRIKYHPLPQGDPIRRQPDICKARKH